MSTADEIAGSDARIATLGENMARTDRTGGRRLGRLRRGQDQLRAVRSMRRSSPRRSTSAMPFSKAAAPGAEDAAARGDGAFASTIIAPASARAAPMNPANPKIVHARVWSHSSLGIAAAFASPGRRDVRRRREPARDDRRRLMKAYVNDPEIEVQRAALRAADEEIPRQIPATARSWRSGRTRRSSRSKQVDKSRAVAVALPAGLSLPPRELQPYRRSATVGLE